jgi:ammonia channel protein AmtB
MRILSRSIVVVGMLLMVAVMMNPVLAQEPAVPSPPPGGGTQVLKVDTGDTAWVLTSSALVLAMTMPGLATVTPGAGFIGPFAALVIGLTAGVVCYLAVVWKTRLGYDDSLDVVGIHGVGGVLGILATGLFASIGAKGLFMGNPAQLGIQAVTVLATVLFALVGTYILLKIINAVVGLRVDAEDEQRGLDISQHEERAYAQD